MRRVLGVRNGLGCGYITPLRGLYKAADIDVLTSPRSLAQCLVLPGKPYRYLLRIPEELRKKLDESAKEQGRSFNAEVGHRLARSFEPRWSWPNLSIQGRGRKMDVSTLRRRPRWVITGLTVAAAVAVVAGTALGVGGGNDARYQPGSEAKVLSEFGRAPVTESGSVSELMARNAFFMSRRTAGALPLDTTQAGAQRAEGAGQRRGSRRAHAPTGPTTFDAAWGGLGPNPIVQGLRSPGGCPAVRRDGRPDRRHHDEEGRHDPPRRRAGRHLEVDRRRNDGRGALDRAHRRRRSRSRWERSPCAPSNDLVVYGGTGEGHLSGDSYFGNGILKSTDGGTTWSHVSGDYFRGVAISRIVVDPTNANHVYAAVLRGRGGARRVTPPVHSRFGIWESTNGGVSWTLLKEVPEANGATDIEMDPQNPSILYASFWGDAMYKSTNGGATWTPIMNGIPGTPAEHLANGTRFSIAIAHPAGQGTTLYAGFDWIAGTHKPAGSSSRPTAARAGRCFPQGRPRRAPTTSRTTAPPVLLRQHHRDGARQPERRLRRWLVRLPERHRRHVPLGRRRHRRGPTSGTTSTRTSRSSPSTRTTRTGSCTDPTVASGTARIAAAGSPGRAARRTPSTWSA